MKDIKDYFGTKTAIKCENEQQWEKLKELCGDSYEGIIGFRENMQNFCLNTNDLMKIGFSISDWFDYNILPYSDFVRDVPELVGVEMEVSDFGTEWFKSYVVGKINGRYLTEKLNLYNMCRPITKKVLTATLTELAEMLNVDEIQLK